MVSSMYGPPGPPEGGTEKALIFAASYCPHYRVSGQHHSLLPSENPLVHKTKGKGAERVHRVHPHELDVAAVLKIDRVLSKYCMMETMNKITLYLKVVQVNLSQNIENKVAKVKI